MDKVIGLIIKIERVTITSTIHFGSRRILGHGDMYCDVNAIKGDLCSKTLQVFEHNDLVYKKTMVYFCSWYNF